MYRRLIFLASLFLLLTASVVASPKVVQSLVVDFPSNGRVLVQAREEIGKFPEMLFTSEKSGKVLLHQVMREKDRDPDSPKDSLQPVLRFRIIRSTGFATPLIMAVHKFYGGSDDAFFLSVFGEIQREIKSLVTEPIFTQIQGGYYLGHINKKFDYGLVAWNFIWDFGNENHYTKHKYEAHIFKLNGGTFHRILRRISKRKYEPNGTQSLHEIGIYVHDQRTGIPVIKDSLN